MKLITTIVRPERLPEVKAALFQAGVTGITLSRVSGHGGEQEIVSQYRGTTVVMEFHEKVKIEMVCSEPFVEPCIKRSEEHTSELQSRLHLVCRLLLEKKKKTHIERNRGYLSDYPPQRVAIRVLRGALTIRPSLNKHPIYMSRRRPIRAFLFIACFTRR